MLTSELKPLLGEVVRVTWNDVLHTDEQSTLLEILADRMEPMISYGKLIHVDSNVVTISSTVTTDRSTISYKDTTRIYRSLVKYVVKMREVD